MSENYNQRVVCAANKYLIDGKEILILGARHFDRLMCESLKICENMLLLEKEVQGFVDQRGKFLTREEAYVIASENGQIIRSIGYETDRLYSEHLY